MCLCVCLFLCGTCNNLLYDPYDLSFESWQSSLLFHTLKKYINSNKRVLWYFNFIRASKSITSKLFLSFYYVLLSVFVMLYGQRTFLVHHNSNYRSIMISRRNLKLRFKIPEPSCASSNKAKSSEYTKLTH